MPQRLQAVLIWACASAATVAIGLGILRILGTFLGALWYASPLASIVILIALLLGGPLAILVAGIKRRRFGMVLGPLLLIPLVTGWEVASDWLELRRLTHSTAALDTRAFATPESHHTILVMESSQGMACDQLCQLILVNSDYDVVVRGAGPGGIVYREISHAQCLETWYVRHNLQFFGICVTTDGVNRIDDGLFIETPMTLPSRNVFPTSLDYRFDGMAYALVERQQGDERVLSRWIAGNVKVGWFESDQIGQNFTREAFYRAALGMRLEIKDLQNSTWLWEAR
jgi:hypothetical protein